MKKRSKINNNKVFIIVFIVILFICIYNIKFINKPYDILKDYINSFFIINYKDNKEVINAEINELNNEINDLKKALDIQNVITDKKTIYASILKRSPNYWYNYITINKGAKNGIKKGNYVMSNDGVVGEVVIVNKNSSEIKLLTNIDNNYISAKFIYNNKEYFGLIKKYDVINNEFYLEDVIGDFENIKDIDVITSGLSSNAPSGLLIGKIKKVINDKYNLSNKIIIEPSSDFNSINIVRVVLK